MTSRRRGPAHRQRVFRHGLLRAGAIAGVLVGVSLLAGILGYHHFADLGWVDSFYVAAMILGGMGPTDPLRSDPAKIFAGLYALYSGLVLIASTAVILSPFMTHVLHVFHAEHDKEDGK
jgi:MFS family permease